MLCGWQGGGGGEELDQRSGAGSKIVRGTPCSLITWWCMPNQVVKSALALPFSTSPGGAQARWHREPECRGGARSGLAGRMSARGWSGVQKASATAKLKGCLSGVPASGFPGLKLTRSDGRVGQTCVALSGCMADVALRRWRAGVRLAFTVRAETRSSNEATVKFRECHADPRPGMPWGEQRAARAPILCKHRRIGNEA